MTGDHPEDWSKAEVSEEVRRALQLVENEAARHNAEYAAGMRNARQIIETELDL